MNPKAANTAKPAPRSVSQKDKDSAKQCLILADKFLKESNFTQARAEVANAQKLDPTNPYAYAFLDRIAYFEEQKKKELFHPPVSSPQAHPEPKAEPAVPKSIPAPPVDPVQKKVEVKAEPVPPKIVPPPQPKKEPVPPQGEKKPELPSPPPRPLTPPAPEPKPPAKPVVVVPDPKLEPPPPPPPMPVVPPPQSERTVPVEDRRAKHEEMIEASRPVIADVMAARSKAPAQSSPPGIADMIQELSQVHHSPSTRGGDVDTKLDEMKRQIEMLTSALEQERKVREEMNQQQLKGAIKQVRTALEKAWANGAPKDSEIDKLHDLAISLGIPEDVTHTLNREVKLEMYSRAVKEVVSKQNLVRNSSKTLEWLRKVYQVSLDEYLEYESKFLMDLVADQYKGTILLVSGDEQSGKDVGLKLKSMGYAVVNASSPENALEKIEKINPHFILCEMEFSHGYLSGVKFLHVLRANSKFSYIPFILLCQPNEVSQLTSSELRPTEGFIEKPFQMDGLNAVMNEKLTAFRKYLSSI